MKDLFRFRCDLCGYTFLSANPAQTVPCARYGCRGWAQNLGPVDPPERRERWYCRSCEAYFWVEEGVETATGGPPFCPYCGSDKDTERR
jgi:rubrerythrin